MQIVQLSQNPKANGLRLALLNTLLAAFCIVSFLGVLTVITAINQNIYANGGAPADAIPFPFPLLLLLYAALFPVVWMWFGGRLPGSQRERSVTAWLGAVPLFGLSFLGYISMVGAIIVNQVNPQTIPIATVFVSGGMATLILLAGIVCVGIILWRGGRKEEDEGLNKTSSTVLL
jgi:hypothetical protein